MSVRVDCSDRWRELFERYGFTVVDESDGAEVIVRDVGGDVVVRLAGELRESVLPRPARDSELIAFVDAALSRRKRRPPGRVARRRPRTRRADLVAQSWSRLATTRYLCKTSRSRIERGRPRLG